MSDNPMAKKRSSHKGSRDQDQDPTMETKILENCVRKILALLAIGFGEAGAEVRRPALGGLGHPLRTLGA